MTSRRSAVLLTAMAASMTVAACGADSGISVESSRRLASPPETTVATTPPATDDPAGPTDPTTPGTAPGPTAVPLPADDLVDEGNAKPDRPYDEAVLLAVGDLDHWWSEIYPEIYGSPYEPLEGGIYPVYPARSETVPGCGGTETTYEDIREMIAFYCSLGDFIAFDDGDGSLLLDLAERLESDAVLAIVMAHEWGHAIQQRNGDLEGQHPTIVTEQQADCFAGAWTARAVDGEVGGLVYDQTDVRAGMIAMIEVRDPIGFGQHEPGAHGSGFDRVGAFQVGYLEGAARCAELIDEPLPLMPNEFVSDIGRNPHGDSEWGYGETQTLGFLVPDLNGFWQAYFERAGGGEFPTLSIVPVQSASDVDCDDSVSGIAPNVLYCQGTGEVFFDERYARELHTEFGDFTLGYLFGTVWADVAQQLWNSPLEGRARSLLNDCLTGAYTRDIVPVGGQMPSRGVIVEPGDLDEAILTAIMISDDRADDDLMGTAFEKVNNYRDGVLNGIPACRARIGG